MKIAYEPHPVPKDRKAELRDQGFKIIDARFDPNRSDEEAVKPLPTREEIAKMPKPELLEWLRAHGVEEPKGQIKDLRKRLTSIMFADL
ncbi:hypothetical protein [Pseudophaeobacter sp.]|uniref:hypothetical protein n=1 Tax=Pseudophaeobacter sp. TaxID=1971739 RepID=UPI003299FC68